MRFVENEQTNNLALEITLDKKTTTEGLIKIRLTEGDYQPHVEKTVKDYARKANIKGFRQGKVPSGVIRKMFGKSILVDEINHILSDRLSGYIRENNLKIIGEPLPNQEKAFSIDWDAQKDFEFEYQIGLVEDFALELSKKVKVKGYAIDVNDTVIEETVGDLKKRFGNVSYPETSGASDNLFGELRQKEGSYVNENAVIALEKTGKEQKKLTGLKKGDEVELDIRQLYKEDRLLADTLNQTEEEAGKASGIYIFRVNNITRTEPAEMGQELFDRVFGREVVTSEAEFVAKVRETIGENYKRETDHFLEHNIEDKLLERTRINLPDEFLKSWLKTTGKGEVTDDVLIKEYDHYARGLKWDLIKNKIADDNGIKVEADEIRDRAKEMIISQFGGQSFADQFKDQIDTIANNYLTNENGQNFTRLHNQLKNEKILKYIRENISVEDQTVSLDDFQKIVQEHKH